jgi:hypothetical protein
MKTKHFVVWMVVLSFVAMSSLALAEDKGQGGMPGMKMEGHGDMKMEGHGDMPAKSGGHNMDMGEKIFSGKVGPWTAEARLVDMKAQMEKSGVSAKNSAKFAGQRHLMLFLTDPATKKAVTATAGKVVVTGPDKASSSKATLVVMGAHIGADVAMPTPGKYTFQAEIESAGKKGSATFSYVLK